jgi:glycosyltransferase involved in cell wall biosynthesis
MPSKTEGLGSSALWAMAYGLPVVATRVGGLPEIVVENETGWLIPPSSPAALADAIFLASRDREKLIAFGRNGRNRAEGFSAAIMVNSTEALYQRLVCGRLPRC